MSQGMPAPRPPQTRRSTAARRAPGQHAPASPAPPGTGSAALRALAGPVFAAGALAAAAPVTRATGAPRLAGLRDPLPASPTAASGTAGWRTGRLDAKGRLPVRDLLEDGASAWTARAVPGALLLLPADPADQRPGVLAARGSRLTVPVAWRIRVGLPAPGDVVVARHADGWAVVPAATLGRLVHGYLAGQLPPDPDPGIAGTTAIAGTTGGLDPWSTA